MIRSNQGHIHLGSGVNIFGIEAINSGGAKEHKQKAPCIFANSILSHGVVFMTHTPLAPIILRFFTSLYYQFYEI